MEGRRGAGWRVMEVMHRVLGEEHPDTLASMANLAYTYFQQGRWKEAEELELRVLEVRRRVLGEEHPDSLTSMVNLAITYWRQGRQKEAEQLTRQVLEKRNKVLGDNHPDTLATAAWLAHARLGKLQSGFSSSCIPGKTISATTLAASHRKAALVDRPTDTGSGARGALACIRRLTCTHSIYFPQLAAFLYPIDRFRVHSVFPTFCNRHIPPHDAFPPISLTPASNRSRPQPACNIDVHPHPRSTAQAPPTIAFPHSPSPPSIQSILFLTRHLLHPRLKTHQYMWRKSNYIGPEPWTSSNDRELHLSRELRIDQSALDGFTAHPLVCPWPEPVEGRWPRARAAWQW